MKSMVKKKEYYGIAHSYEFVYLISYSIFLIVSILRETMFWQIFDGNVYNLIVLGCVLLLVAKECLETNYRASFFIALAIIVFMTLIVRKDSTLTSAALFFYIYSGRNISFKKISRITIWITLSLITVVIVLSRAGMITNYIADKDGERKREYLGFLYALFPSAFLMNALLLIFYQKKEKMSWLAILLFSLANYWIYQKTNSRLSFIMISFVIVCGIFIKVRKHFYHRRYIYNPFKFFYVFLGVFSYFICFGVSIYAAINYDDSQKWQVALNRVLTQRMAYSHRSYLKYGFGLFGQRISWVGNGLLTKTSAWSERNRFYVDNVFLQILQRYGLIMSLILLIAISWVLFRCYEKKDWYLFFILLLLAVHAMIDDLVIHLAYNTFLIAVGQNIFCEAAGNEGDVTMMNAKDGRNDDR